MLWCTITDISAPLHGLPTKSGNMVTVLPIPGCMDMVSTLFQLSNTLFPSNVGICTCLSPNEYMCHVT